MKILLLAGSYPPETGGIARFMRGFVEGLTRCGVAVEVISGFSVQPGSYIDQIRAWKEEAAARCKDDPVDRMVASSWSPFAVGLPLKTRGGRIPFDVFCHGMDLLEPSRSLRYRLLMRRTLQRASRILANSSYTAGLAVELGARRDNVIIVPPGVDTRRFTPGPAARPSRPPTILSVGRLVERKGFDLVLRAMPRVVEQFPEAVYVCAGGGPDETRLKDIAAEFGVSGHVQFISEPTDCELLDLYRNADVFVMPNRIVASEGSVEGFGIVFLEAAACGLPVIGGHSGGAPDAIEDGVTGFLADPHDFGALASKICELLGNPELRRKMGDAGRKRAIRRFGEDRIAERYLEGL